jgi:hypothetical protein
LKVATAERTLVGLTPSAIGRAIGAARRRAIYAAVRAEDPSVPALQDDKAGK